MKRRLSEAEWFSFFSSAPSRAGVEGCPDSSFLRVCRRKRRNSENCKSGLRTSPVSWLGGVACKHPSRTGISKQFALCSGWLANFRLTVARRRRLACLPPISRRTLRLPVHEVRDDCGGALGPL